jgi:outer membrane lipoprotein-sorting protein
MTFGLYHITNSHTSSEKLRIALFLIVIGFALAACAPASPIAPKAAQQQLQQAWQSDQHAILEIEWPNAPIHGPVSVEVWQAGDRYRYEILETPAPALLGETLVSDGNQTWRYNRLASSPPPRSTVPTLAPITDVRMLVSNLLSRQPIEATIQSDSVNLLPTKKILMLYPTGDSLAMWLDEQAAGLPRRVEFSVGQQHGQLTARLLEPLTNPPPVLFTVDDWVQ